jgi:hypothetical protein
VVSDDDFIQNHNQIMRLQDEKIALAQRLLDLFDRQSQRLDKNIECLVSRGLMPPDALVPSIEPSQRDSRQDCDRRVSLGFLCTDGEGGNGEVEGDGIDTGQCESICKGENSGNHKCDGAKATSMVKGVVSNEGVDYGSGDCDGERREEVGISAECICSRVLNDNIAFCYDKNCLFGKFHWGCIGLTEEPGEMWICPFCHSSTTRVQLRGF